MVQSAFPDLLTALAERPRARVGLLRELHLRIALAPQDMPRPRPGEQPEIPWAKPLRAALAAAAAGLECLTLDMQGISVKTMEFLPLEPLTLPQLRSLRFVRWALMGPLVAPALETFEGPLVPATLALLLHSPSLTALHNRVGVHWLGVQEPSPFIVSPKCLDQLREALLKPAWPKLQSLRLGTSGFALFGSALSTAQCVDSRRALRVLHTCVLRRPPGSGG